MVSAQNAFDNFQGAYINYYEDKRSIMAQNLESEASVNAAKHDELAESYINEL